jgi:CRP-like cAMP-binding protein
MAVHHKEKFLQRTWLKGLPPATVDAVAKLAYFQPWPDGHRLFSRGDKPLAYFGVTTGAVRFTRANHAGKEMILDVAAPGTFFGEISILGDKGRGYDAQCLGDTLLLTVNADDFHALFDRDQIFRRHVVKRMCARIDAYYDSFEDVLLLKLSARIAKRLLGLARAQQSLHGGSLVLDAGLSQENLASMFGISRQSLNKYLVEWKERDWIEVQYGRIAIRDMHALQAVSEEHESGRP